MRGYGMAAPVTELRLRLRNAGVSEEQADATSGTFEALNNPIADLSNQCETSSSGNESKWDYCSLWRQRSWRHASRPWANMAN
jgi:hypothetical protein